MEMYSFRIDYPDLAGPAAPAQSHFRAVAATANQRTGSAIRDVDIDGIGDQFGLARASRMVPLRARKQLGGTSQGPTKLSSPRYGSHFLHVPDKSDG
jgi:hypothetical protein